MGMGTAMMAASVLRSVSSVSFNRRVHLQHVETACDNVVLRSCRTGRYHGQSTPPSGAITQLTARIRCDTPHSLDRDAAQEMSEDRGYPGDDCCNCNPKDHAFLALDVLPKPPVS